MKKIFLLFLWIFAGLWWVFGFDVPAYEWRVTDTADVLSSIQESELNQKLEDFAQTQNVEVAILTLPDLDDNAIEEVAIQVADTWKVWRDTLDSGIIVLVAIDERQRRIETWYGVEWDIPDILAYQLGDSLLVPAFREWDYAWWLSRLIDAFTDLLSGVFPDTSSDDNVWAALDDRIWWLFMLGILSFVLAVILRAVFDQDLALRTKAANIWPLTTWVFWMLIWGSLVSGMILFWLMSVLRPMIMIAQQTNNKNTWPRANSRSRWWRWWFSSSGWRWGGSFGGWFSWFGGWSFGGWWASGSR